MKLIIRYKNQGIKSIICRNGNGNGMGMDWNGNGDGMGMKWERDWEREHIQKTQTNSLEVFGKLIAECMV